MHLTDLLTSRYIASDVEVNSKKRVLEYLSQLIAGRQSDLTPTEVFENLVARERLGSTGVGHGVAIPHARLKNLDHPICAFVKLKHGVDFDAADRQPVDLLCALLVPEKSTGEHLELLSMLAEMFSDAEYCQQLRAARNEDELYGLLSQWQPHAHHTVSR
jgi:PTS system nitrogen regulatory IIA component